MCIKPSPTLTGADDGYGGIALAAAVPCFVLADATKPSKPSGTAKPDFDMNRVVDALICLALPALGVTMYQDGKVDKVCSTLRAVEHCM